jgi:hypothetical protein
LQYIDNESKNKKRERFFKKVSIEYKLKNEGDFHRKKLKYFTEMARSSPLRSFTVSVLSSANSKVYLCSHPKE